MKIRFLYGIMLNESEISMKKRSIIIILGTILIVGIVVFLISPHVINWLFSSQYNKNGVSHFLVVTIDENQSREYIGELDNHRIYIENLNIKETNFRNINAENVSIKEAIEEKLVTIAEWKKYAWKIKKDGDAEVLKYDNYEIACAYDDCIIRPLSK